MDQILEILENNARASVADMAKMLDKSEADIEKKIKEYEDKGVIVQYKTMINHSLIQKTQKVQALIEVEVSPQENYGFDAVAEKIYQYPEVVNCYLLSGGYDLHLLVEGEDLHEVANFVSQKLAPLDHVKATKTHFLLKKYKEAGAEFKKREEKRLNISY